MPQDFSRVTRTLDQAQSAAVSSNDRVHHIRSVPLQIDAIARGDYAAVLADAHADVELDIFAPPEFPWIRHARGKDELQRALGQNFGSLEDQQPEIVNVVAQGDVVVLIGRERGRICESCAPYEVEFVQRFTFRDRRLAAVRVIVARAV